MTMRMLYTICAVLAATLPFGAADAGAQTAVDHLRNQCSRNDANSCFVLGMEYHRGVIVAADHQAEAQLVDRACEMSLAKACTRMGQLFEQGAAVPKDAGRAREMYQRACNAGDQPGCQALRAMGPSLPDDRSATQMLVGRWRDENSQLTYHSDGTFYYKWDNGGQATGTYRVEGGRLVVTFAGSGNVQRIPLLAISPTSFRIQDARSGTVYNATRLP
jgi:TPR repeat protein